MDQLDEEAKDRTTLDPRVALWIFYNTSFLDFKYLHTAFQSPYTHDGDREVIYYIYHRSSKHLK